MPRGTPKTVAVAPFPSKGAKFFSSFCYVKGGGILYLTLEQLMLLGTFIVALLQIVLNNINKKK